MSNIRRFIDSIDVPNTEKVVRYVLEGVVEDFLKFNIVTIYALINASEQRLVV